MKQIKLAVMALGIALSLVAVPVYAADTTEQSSGIWDGCEGVASDICKDKTQATDIVKRLINVFLFAIGALAVIMIIHSGFKYTTSRGDAEGVKSAKNTLLYAVIGLIVASMAFAIVNFVIGAFNEPSTGVDPNNLQQNQQINEGE